MGKRAYEPRTRPLLADVSGTLQIPWRLVKRPGFARIGLLSPLAGCKGGHVENVLVMNDKILIPEAVLSVLCPAGTSAPTPCDAQPLHSTNPMEARAHPPEPLLRRRAGTRGRIGGHAAGGPKREHGRIP